ncbi:hypothetical protein [Leptothoe sp. PORK10 BA2]|uniref:hypothetical protein n=1 Tax=Leptothoe sp. PORK10 BA2 TaxID=3110254 RepID=UPI002B1F1B92|nr:hypothetical protein [Leptothoe sp. PORK10 BA2]MEA5465273.1 hypothetical protein [Leptothoe sp. PORK10 BA2]
MSFTDPDKEAIRHYLGYPVDQASIDRIQNRCAAVESLSSGAVDTAQGHIRKLQQLDKQLTQATPFAAQTFSSNAGGTNQYVPGQRLRILKDEARRHVGELASALQLTISRDIYAAAAGQTGRVMRA